MTLSARCETVHRNQLQKRTPRENIIWNDFSSRNFSLEFSFSFTFNFVVIWKHFRYVRMIQQTCVKFHRLFSNSEFSSTQLYFTWTYINILPLFRSRVPSSVSVDGVKNSQVEYKNYLSYTHFLSSSSPSFTLLRLLRGGELIIKWFFFSSFHSALPQKQHAQRYVCS